MTITEEFFASRSLASGAAAQRIAKAIESGLADTPKASIVVTGGSTPEDCYRMLANTALSWGRVLITLSDDRCVPVDHDASNAGMIQRSLIANHAAEAELVTIYDQDRPERDQCELFETKLKSIHLPFEISLLGIGNDGHIASLFADVEQIAEGLNAESDRNCMLIETSASPHRRISLTMPAILNSRELLLLFFGDTKRDVYEQSKLPESAYPLSRLLLQQQTPVHTIWAP